MGAKICTIYAQKKSSYPQAVNTHYIINNLKKYMNINAASNRDRYTTIYTEKEAGKFYVSI